MTIMTLATACSFRWTRFKFTRSSRALASTVIGAVSIISHERGWARVNVGLREVVRAHTSGVKSSQVKHL